QGLRERRDDLAALAAAHPFRERDRLAPYAVETERLEFRDDPLARLEVVLAAGKARADLGCEAFGEVPRGVVSQRLVAQLRRRRDVAGRQRGRLAGRNRDWRGEQEREGEHGRSAHGGSPATGN